jgi:hypothetical protein
MSQLLPVRGFNRSQRVGIGGKDLRPDRSVYVNIDNKRVIRDLARHSTLGAIFPVGATIFQDDKGVVEVGGTVATRATTLVVDVSAASGQKTDGTNWSAAAGTATVGAADATNPRVDTIAVNVNTGAFSVIAGTATAGAQISVPAQTGFLAGKAAVGANLVALAVILVPATATTLLQANVVDVRP